MRFLTCEGGIRMDEVVAEGEKEVVKDEVPQTLNTARSAQLPNSSFILPTSRIMSKIRFQPVGSLPPACALPSASSLLISTTKLQHKIPDAKNQPFIIRKNLLTNRLFRLKKPKRYVCAR